MLSNTLTIAVRQFRGYFNGPVAYIVICIVLITVFPQIVTWLPDAVMGVSK